MAYSQENDVDRNDRCTFCQEKEDGPCISYSGTYIADQEPLPRAFTSLPEQLKMHDREEMKKHGWGVFAGSAIPENTIFGPLAGMLCRADDPTSGSSAVFGIAHSTGVVLHYSLKSDHHSNWMKYIRLSDGENVANMMAYQHGQLVYFVTARELDAGEEMCVGYSPQYAQLMEKASSDTERKLRNKEATSPVNEEVRKPSNVAHHTFKTSPECSPIPAEKSRKRDARESHSPEISPPERYKHSARQELSPDFALHAFVQANLQRDIRQDDGRDEEKFECPICQRQFSGFEQLRPHIEATHFVNGKYLCQLCPMKCEEWILILQHIRDAHRDQYLLRKLPSSSPGYVTAIFIDDPLVHCDADRCCPICNESFPGSGEAAHGEEHRVGGNFSCPECGLAYNNWDRLVHHMQTKHKAKTYLKRVRGQKGGPPETSSCQTCQKSFKSMPDLNRHIQMGHARALVFGCDTCGKKFKSRGNLLCHTQMHVRKVGKSFMKKGIAGGNP